MSVNVSEKKYIDAFVNEVIKEVDHKININYDYNEMLDTFVIYHDINFDTDKQTKELIGSIINNILLENDIYNFSLEHNPIKSTIWTTNISDVYKELCSFINVNNSNRNYYYPVDSRLNFISNDIIAESPRFTVNMSGINLKYDIYEEKQKNGQEVLAA